MIGVSGDIMSTERGMHFFTVETTVLKKRHDKNDCINYDSRYGYKQCVEKTVRTKIDLFETSFLLITQQRKAVLAIRSY